MKFEDAIKKLDAEGQKQIYECKSLEDIIETFKSRGLSVAEADICEAVNKRSTELSDDELDQVTGGIALDSVVQWVIRFVFDKGSDLLKGNDDKGLK